MVEAMRNSDSLIKRSSVKHIAIQMQYIGLMVDLGFLMLSLDICRIFLNFGPYQAINQGHFITIIKGFITWSHTSIWSGV